MCTAISDYRYRHLFGRTLDLEYSYNEKIVITPKKFVFDWRCQPLDKEGFAIIGVAHITNGYPLYYDAANEKGLAIAALNFPHKAKYNPSVKGKLNLASFELIPFLLRRCENVSSTLNILNNTNITKDRFLPSLSPTPLHWLIADKNMAITVEQTSEGLKIYENKVGVLTNSPEFPYHEINLSNYMSLSPKAPKNFLCPKTEFQLYSRGMGGFGLPGDFSSSSRFIKAVFAKNHTVHENSTEKEISRFFHIMDTVAQPKGCVETDEGAPISTVYTSCADTEAGIYYYTTYNCRQIREVNMQSYPLDSDKLIAFPMEREDDILFM